jgi:imidazolonepropionase-like amidohydrolase
VREQFRRGADLIKIASHFSPAEVRAAVDEAHALGLRVTADAETFYIQWAVEAGVDVIEHPLPRSDSTIRLMAERGTAAVPTLTTYQYIFDTRGGYYGSTSRRFSFSKDANVAMLRRLKAAGVPSGIGTDLVGAWYRHLPGAYHTELELFVAAGYTPVEALEAATRVSAAILDMGDRLGTIEPGKLADLIAVEGRPLENLRDLARVRVVVRDGEVVVDGGRIVVLPHIQVPEPRGPRRP